MDQTTIFDFIEDIPELGKEYSMLFPAKVGQRGATATVIRVDQENGIAYCDIKSNINGMNPWYYSTKLSFKDFYEAIEKMDIFLNRKPGGKKQ